MAKNHSHTALSAAVGALLTVGIAAPTAADAANPFGLTELASGYMLGTAVAANADPQPTEASEREAQEGSCGEGKCGEGACGEDKDGEGSCGAHADEAADKGESEGRCGEGRCGGAA